MVLYWFKINLFNTVWEADLRLLPRVYQKQVKKDLMGILDFGIWKNGFLWVRKTREIIWIFTLLKNSDAFFTITDYLNLKLIMGDIWPELKFTNIIRHPVYVLSVFQLYCQFPFPKY
jgi:hypothetical protein